MPPKLFRFTQFPKNAFATPLVSHTFKTTIQPGMVVLSEHREPKDPSEPSKAFRLIHFRKKAPANPLESHTFKTKDLKPFRFTHFQKKGRGWVPFSNIQPQTDHPTRSGLWTPVESTGLLKPEMVVPSERSESRDLPSALRYAPEDWLG